MFLKDQERAKLVVERFLTSGRIPSGLLIYGPPGVGKTTLALDFAGSLLCLGESTWYCGSCNSCRAFLPLVEAILEDETADFRFEEEVSGRKRFLYLRGEHPDFIFVSPDGNTIKIDQIRAVREFAYRKPALSERKAVIIDGVDLMTVEAGNSLLKVLEEPPEDTVLILTAVSREGILPTILSRTLQVPLGPLSKEAFEGITGSGDLYEISGGSVTRASLVSSNADIIEMAQKFMDASPSVAYGIAVSSDRWDSDQKILFLDLLEDFVMNAFRSGRMEYDRFELVQRRLGELRDGLPRGIRLSLGLMALYELMEV